MKKLTLYYGRQGNNALTKLVHYLRQPVREDSVTLMALPENTLHVKQLATRNTLWFNPLGGSMAEIITQLCMVINAANPLRLEIHIDLLASKDDLLLLLKQLWSRFGRQRLQLCLYDDSVPGIDERIAIAHLPKDKLRQAENVYTQALEQSLTAENPIVSAANWNPLLNYLWHRLCPTSYHLTDENLLRFYDIPFFNRLLKLTPRATPLTAEQQQTLQQLAAPQAFVNSPSLLPYTPSNAQFIKLHASMGDLVFGLGSIKALWQQQTQPRVLITSKAYHPLALANPYVDEVWDVDSVTTEQYFQLRFAQEQQRYQIWGKWEHFISGLHMTDAFLGTTAQRVSAEDKTVELETHQRDGQTVDDFMAEHQLDGQRVVLLHPNIGAPNRTWPASQWRDIARLMLEDGWQVVIIGSSHNKYAYKQMLALDNPQLVSAVDRFSVFETLELMKRCNLLIATDSGPIALASATDIAICGIYSILPGERRLPYRHGVAGWNALAINLGCQYSPCADLMLEPAFYQDVLKQPYVRPTGASFADWCPNAEQYGCLKHYSAQQLFADVKRFVASKDFIPHPPA